LSKGEKAVGVSPPLEKGAGGISFHSKTVLRAATRFLQSRLKIDFLRAH
jgi:hypothetical protein